MLDAFTKNTICNRIRNLLAVLVYKGLELVVLCRGYIASHSRSCRTRSTSKCSKRRTSRHNRYQFHLVLYVVREGVLTSCLCHYINFSASRKDTRTTFEYRLCPVIVFLKVLFRRALWSLYENLCDTVFLDRSRPVLFTDKHTEINHKSGNVNRSLLFDVSDFSLWKFLYSKVTERLEFSVVVEE